MDYHTTAEWDEALWRKAESVYHEAFPEHGRKKLSIIKRMFERRMCELHTLSDDSDVLGMALTGVNEEAEALIIDYFAISAKVREQGVGRLFLDSIKRWAEQETRCIGIIIEVESESTPENIGRVRFWERCGFHATDYVHHYSWVPEPYRAMYFNFHEKPRLPDDGQMLFRSITDFHKRAYTVTIK
jgi:GNAT superfamily N-acetyltransferase